MFDRRVCVCVFGARWCCSSLRPASVFLSRRSAPPHLLRSGLHLHARRCVVSWWPLGHQGTLETHKHAPHSPRTPPSYHLSYVGPSLGGGLLWSQTTKQMQRLALAGWGWPWLAGPGGPGCRPPRPGLGLLGSSAQSQNSQRAIAGRPCPHRPAVSFPAGSSGMPPRARSFRRHARREPPRQPPPARPPPRTCAAAPTGGQAY